MQEPSVALQDGVRVLIRFLVSVVVLVVWQE